ncbi:M23 family metallopeptidase [Prolixibacteraceae bacterium JC049]|nr:M23 family metallopeptidase [Prolixibacteraceae bacterium JC049]
MKKQKKQIVERLKNRYRITLFNDATFHESFSLKLSGLRMFTAIAVVASVLVAFTTLVIAYTPLRELIPGYPSGEMRKQIIQNSLTVDSLQYQLEVRDKFIQNFQTLIKGEVPEETVQPLDTAIRINQIQFSNFNHDSVFQDKILEEKLNLSLLANEKEVKKLSEIHFFVPLRGNITSEFKTTPDHFGIDITAEDNSRISSVLDGTVIFAGWTTDAGYVLQVQHSNDLVSVYKHNSELLKRIGDKVRAGEAIAIMGNSGEVTTGPHLHFELWHKGVALDPQNYINF